MSVDGFAVHGRTMNRGETFGNYRIVRRIGVGGMGEVYEVEHLALGTRYALKTFALESGDAAFLRERFMAEGRALARIAHPNVARVFDLGVMPDGTAYFVMERGTGSDPFGGVESGGVAGIML